MTKTERAISRLNGTLTEAYGAAVNRLIRERYTIADEFAILRQANEKPEEWAEYNAFCEECKKKAKEEMEAV